MNEKYEVEIKEKYGSCASELFEKIAKNGDITATKVKDIVGKDIEITGYAICEIKTKEKTFTIVYYATEGYGFISSGSEVFLKSVKMYIEDTNAFNIKEVKTSKGTTYKAVPVLFVNDEK